MKSLSTLGAGLVLALAGSCVTDGKGESGSETEESGTDNGDCPVGTLGCPCTGGGACDPGLECLSDTCVDLGGETSAADGSGSGSGSADGGTTGTGDTGASSTGDGTSTTAGSTGGGVCGDGTVDPEEVCDDVAVVCFGCATELSPAIWLDASDSSTVMAPGGDVSEWLDKSANAYSMFPVDAAPPVGAAQNGLETIAFDGSQGMTAPNTTTALSGDFTAFVVVKYDQANTFNSTFGKMSDTAGSFVTDVDWAFGTWDDSRYAVVVAEGQALGLTVRGGTQDSSYHVLSATWSAGATLSLRLDGQLLDEMTQTLTLKTTLPFSVGGSDPSRRLKGNIGEAIAYDDALPAEQRMAVEQHLLDKWGI